MFNLSHKFERNSAEASGTQAAVEVLKLGEIGGLESLLGENFDGPEIVQSLESDGELLSEKSEFVEKLAAKLKFAEESLGKVEIVLEILLVNF